MGARGRLSLLLGVADCLHAEESAALPYGEVFELGIPTLRGCVMCPENGFVSGKAGLRVHAESDLTDCPLDLDGSLINWHALQVLIGPAPADECKDVAALGPKKASPQKHSLPRKGFRWEFIAASFVPVVEKRLENRCRMVWFNAFRKRLEHLMTYVSSTFSFAHQHCGAISIDYSSYFGYCGSSSAESSMQAAWYREMD